VTLPRTSEPICSVVIITWNRRAELEVLLDSIDRQTVRDRLEIIIIDNGSTDGTVEWLAKRPALGLRLFAYPENKGACESRNAGILLARSPHTCFIDSDAELISENVIERCLEELAVNPERDAVSCPIWENRERTIAWLMGGYITYDFHYDGWSCKNRTDNPMMFSTCFAVWKTSTLREFGGFDPWFFWGIEDVDLSLRVFFSRAEQGRAAYSMADDVHVLHEMSETGRLFDKDAFVERFRRYENQRPYLVLSSCGILQMFRVVLRTPFRWRRMNEAYNFQLNKWLLFEGSVLRPIPRMLLFPIEWMQSRRNHLKKVALPEEVSRS